MVSVVLKLKEFSQFLLALRITDTDILAYKLTLLNFSPGSQVLTEGEMEDAHLLGGLNPGSLTCYWCSAQFSLEN